MEVPPKMTQRIAAELLAPVRREAGRDGNSALAGKDAFASLPVLGAVRQFIDNERRRTRRMILNLVLLFAVVLLAFIGAFIYLADIQMRHVKKDLQKGQETIAAAASEIGRIKQGIAEETEKLNRQLAEGGKQAELAMTAVQTLDAGMTNAVVELQLLKRNLDGADDLRSRNVKVMSDLEMKWNTLSSRLEELARQNSILRAKLDGRPDIPSYGTAAPATVAGGEETATVVGRTQGILLDLAPSNAELRINWRLPIP